MMAGKQGVSSVFMGLQVERALLPAGGMEVTSPVDGSVIAGLTPDNETSLQHKITQAVAAQSLWAKAPRSQREGLLTSLSDALKQHRELLAELITLEAGKTQKEALGEVDSSADVLVKTAKDAALVDMGGMHRCKERPPVGVVGLITSFNFPLVVANWTAAPALLAGNVVLWKPSEKTPLTALAYKAIFDHIAGDQRGLLQVLIGGRDIGGAMVAHEQVDMVSATGSVAMGKGIKAALARKKNNAVKPILELGGNNGVLISDRFSKEHLAWAVQSLLNSFLGTSGQRCTNTRRLLVQRNVYEQVVALLDKQLRAFIADGVIVSPLSGASNSYGYGPLIDADAYQRLEQAKQRVVNEGGTILLGKRLHEVQWPNAYYVEPALALLPEQTAIMHEEIFAPLLFVCPYDGGISQGLALLNAPANAGLVNGIYTQSQQEADQFSAENQAGHSVINSPKGTGTPAFGMGFGGNKESGEGEILNGADPLRPFTRDTAYHRIAQNAEMAMDFD